MLRKLHKSLLFRAFEVPAPDMQYWGVGVHLVYVFLGGFFCLFEVLFYFVCFL